jgi:hypothetical protein
VSVECNINELKGESKTHLGINFIGKNRKYCTKNYDNGKDMSKVFI